MDGFEPNYPVALKKARAALLRDSFDVPVQILKLEDASALLDWMRAASPDVVVHLAARPGVRETHSAWPDYARSNVAGFLSVLSSMFESGCSSLLYASSSSVYGNRSEGELVEGLQDLSPISIYGTTKLANELLVRAAQNTSAIRAVGVRMFSVYGPWGRPDMLPWRLIRAAQEGSELDIYGDGSARRDFTYVDDVVESLELLIPYLRSLPLGSTDVLNVGGGDDLSVSECVRTVQERLGKPIRTRSAPQQVGDVMATRASTRKLQETIGYAPDTPFGEGILKSLPWFESHRERIIGEGWES